MNDIKRTIDLIINGDLRSFEAATFQLFSTTTATSAIKALDDGQWHRESSYAERVELSVSGKEVAPKDFPARQEYRAQNDLAELAHTYLPPEMFTVSVPASWKSRLIERIDSWKARAEEKDVLTLESRNTLIKISEELGCDPKIVSVVQALESRKNLLDLAPKLAERLNSVLAVAGPALALHQKQMASQVLTDYVDFSRTPLEPMPEEFKVKGERNLRMELAKRFACPDSADDILKAVDQLINQASEPTDQLLLDRLGTTLECDPDLGTCALHAEMFVAGVEQGFNTLAEIHGCHANLEDVIKSAREDREELEYLRNLENAVRGLLPRLPLLKGNADDAKREAGAWIDKLDSVRAARRDPEEGAQP